MKNRFLIMLAAIFFLSSCENFPSITKVKYHTRCYKLNICWNIKYKILDNNFLYKIYFFPGPNHVKDELKGQFNKLVSDENFNIEKLIEEDSPRFEDYLITGIPSKNIRNFHNFLIDNPLTIQLLDRDNFIIKRIEPPFSRKSLVRRTMTGSENFQASIFDGSISLTLGEIREFRDIRTTYQTGTTDFFKTKK